MGLELFVEQTEARLPTVTTIKVPEGVDWKAVTTYAMQKYDFYCNFSVDRVSANLQKKHEESGK